MRKPRSIEVQLKKECIESSIQFLEQWMSLRHINQKSITETVLLVEALLLDLLEQGYDPGTVLTIKPQRSFGESSIKIGFEGAAYVPAVESQYEYSPELRIVQAFNDKKQLHLPDGI